MGLDDGAFELMRHWGDSGEATFIELLHDARANFRYRHGAFLMLHICCPSDKAKTAKRAFVDQLEDDRTRSIYNEMLKAHP